MKQLTVSLKNEPGALGAVCDALEKVGINIISLFGAGTDEKGFVHLITEDDKTAERVLRLAGYEPIISEVLAVKVLDRPGELAKVVRKLAHAKININYISVLTREKGAVTLLLKVDDLKKAIKIVE